jgi:hypothetical protein
MACSGQLYDLLMQLRIHITMPDLVSHVGKIGTDDSDSQLHYHWASPPSMVPSRAVASPMADK